MKQQNQRRAKNLYKQSTREHYYDEKLVQDLTGDSACYSPSGKIKVATSSAVRFARNKLMRQLNFRDKQKIEKIKV